MINIKQLISDLQKVKRGWEESNSEDSFELLNDVIVELSLLPQNYFPIVTIKLDTESIVELLYEYSDNWLETLDFIYKYAKSQNYEINREEISRQMRKKLFGV